MKNVGVGDSLPRITSESDTTKMVSLQKVMLSMFAWQKRLYGDVDTATCMRKQYVCFLAFHFASIRCVDIFDDPLQHHTLASFCANMNVNGSSLNTTL